MTTETTDYKIRGAEFLSEAELDAKRLERMRMRSEPTGPNIIRVANIVICDLCKTDITQSAYAPVRYEDGSVVCMDKGACLDRRGLRPPKTPSPQTQRQNPVGAACDTCGASEMDAKACGATIFLANTQHTRQCSSGCVNARAAGLDGVSMMVRAGLALTKPDLPTAESRAWGEFVTSPAGDIIAFGAECAKAQADCGNRGGELIYILPGLRRCKDACPPPPPPNAGKPPAKRGKVAKTD